jgi:hypothetical protein
LQPLLIGLGISLSLGFGITAARADGVPAPNAVRVETLARTTRSWNGASLPA